jgi:LysM repeat protein|tara:strand:- start:248 stop:628 length:381 start_codon:yes stop_codon:yes gene_type:complete
MPQYKIKSGDTLSQIAKSKGFTIKQLEAANPRIKDPNKIRAGATLQLPYSATGLMSRKKDVGTSRRGPYAGKTLTEMARMAGKAPKKKATKVAMPKKRPAMPTKPPQKKKLAGAAGRIARRKARRT